MQNCCTYWMYTDTGWHTETLKNGKAAKPATQKDAINQCCQRKACLICNLKPEIISI